MKGDSRESPSYRHPHDGVLDLGWQRFGELHRQLVETIRRDYDPDVVVGIAKGGVLPAVCIASALERDFFPVKLSRREDERIVHPTPQVLVPPTPHLRGKRVLVVDDICITMETLNLTRRLIEEVGAAQVRCAALAVHGQSEKPEWYALSTDKLLLNPWDKEVYVDSHWRLNPEYEDELRQMGRSTDPGGWPS